MLIAITRDVSRNIEQCELSHIERMSINYLNAVKQHEAYRDCLVSLGCELVGLPEEPGMPDSVFVEDTAVVLDEIALITRPGAISRRQETIAVESVLARYRHTQSIQPPGTLDGGDVLQMGKRVFIGLTERTNLNAINQVQRMLAPFDYQVEGVEVKGCLHLKSAVTQVGPERLLVNRHWVDTDPLTGYELIDVDAREPYGANALLIGATVIYPAAFPHTRNRLDAAGINIRSVSMSELAKAEGGVTCCSLIFHD